MASQDKVQDVTQKKDEVRKRQTVETADVEQELVSAEQADLATVQRTVANPGGLSSGDVPALQRIVGNRAAARLLAGQSPRVQAKLVVGPAGDKYEREADQVARQVINTVPASSQSPAVQQQRETEFQQIQRATAPTAQTTTLLEQEAIIAANAAIIAANAGTTAEAIAARTAAQTAQTDATALVTSIKALIPGTSGISGASTFSEGETSIYRPEPGYPGIERSAAKIWLKPMADSDNALRRLTGWGTVADKEGLLQEHSFEVSVDLETRLKELAGRGNPLPEKLQEEMENAFKADFSQVIVHADSAADELCQTLSAQAFTHGNDIYFAKDKYKPWSVAGKELIAHELTHVVQQMGYGQQAEQPELESTE